MYAIEFETKVNNGMLEIPLQYKEIRESEDVKVIIMTETKKEYIKEQNKSIFSNFLSMSKQIDSLKSYNRNDLHER